MSVSMDRDLERMLERHGHAAPWEVAAVREGLRSGTCDLASNAPWVSSGTGLLAAYRRRAEWLARFGTEHARALRRDTERLCVRLAAAGDVRCRTWTFDLGRGRSVQFFEDAQTGEPFGVLRTVDHRKVTAEEWAALWGVDLQEARAWRRTLGRAVGRALPGDEPL
jgi:hypothetical protein